MPVKVIVNNKEINVRNANDFQLIENAIEAFSNDDDIVNVVFPIDIILSNHKRVTITNQPQFQKYIDESSKENEIDDDIECIDFNYPISFEVLAVKGSISTTKKIANDEELFEFIENLKNYVAVSINFPVSVSLYDGTEVTVNSIEALEILIKNNVDTCDEDDDFDFDDDDDVILLDFLTQGNWIIDEYVFDDTDFTDDYNDYFFKFNKDAVLTATHGLTIVTGSWVINNTNPKALLFELYLGNTNLFKVLNKKWKIIELEEDRLELEFGSDTNNDLSILVFEKN